MKFEITLGKSDRHLTFNDPTNTLTIDDLLLMIAKEYGNEWYGACVSCPEKNSFICNAVEEYFTELDPSKTVYEHAINTYVMHIRDKAGLYHTSYDWREDCETHQFNYNPFEEVK